MKFWASLLLGFVWFDCGLIAQQPTSALSPSANSEPAATNKTLDDLPLPQLMKRVDANDPAAQNELALRYRYGGIGVEKDRDKAIEWFRKAAQNGSARACFNLGVVYYNGDGLASNPDMACMWFLIGAEAGDPAAKEAVQRSQSELSAIDTMKCEVAAGDTYLLGKEYPRDYAKAMEVYQRAAALKSPFAEQRIAQMYEHGLGVPIDQQKYLEHLQRAATTLPPAAYSLGRIYQTGSLGTRDPKLALQWFERSAMAKFAPSMIALADMYSTGDGLKPDNKKAYMWYLLAVHFGQTDAQEKAQSLAAGLTQKQIKDAKKEADRYALSMVGALSIKQPSTPQAPHPNYP